MCAEYQSSLRFGLRDICLGRPSAPVSVPNIVGPVLLSGRVADVDGNDASVCFRPKQTSGRHALRQKSDLPLLKIRCQAEQEAALVDKAE